MKIKCEGWINIHVIMEDGEEKGRWVSRIFKSRDEAISAIPVEEKEFFPLIETIKIEWEEEINRVI